MSRRFDPEKPPRIVGRYALFHELASGGMATVHLGRLQASAGFARTVAVKRLHEQHAKDPEFVAMLLDEARLAARIHHPNVVATLDVVAEDEELFLVMDYVHGESLARLVRTTVSAGRLVPVPVAVSIIIGMLHGLHAAHEAKSETGEPLDIVHRDMSPQNVMVGADGVTRVLDFGVAKAANRAQTTQEGQLKGKLRYMSPEQLHSQPVTRSSDIFSAAIVAWELLTCQRFIAVDEPGAVIMKLLSDETPRPSTRRKDLDWVADEVLIRGLKRDPAARYATALEFAVAFEKMGPASVAEVSAWVKQAAAKDLAMRAEMLRETESRSPNSLPPPPRSSAHSIPSPDLEPDTQVVSRSGELAAYAPGADASPATDAAHTRVVARPSQSPSQLSSISVTASVAVPPSPPRRRGLVLAVVAVLLVLAAAASGFALRPRAKSPPEAVVPTQATVAAGNPSAAPPAAAPPPVVDPPPPAPSPTSPLASPGPDAATTPITAPSPPRPPAGGRTLPRRPPPRPAPTSTGDPGDILLQR